MAVKYDTSFKNEQGKRYRVEIIDDSYKLPSMELELGPDAVVVTRPKKKITDPIFSMGATIQVWCNKDFEYTSLFATPEQTNQVVIGCDGQVLFRGWVEPNLYEEEFMAPPYLITIPAADGLASLENYYPEGMAGTGLVSLLDIIRNCLRCTGMNLPINIACGLNTGGNEDNRLFEKTFVEKDSLRSFKDGVYEYDNAQKLLEDVLKPFSCRIYQSGGEWHIERIKDRVPETVSWIRYEGSGPGIKVDRNKVAVLDTPDFPFVDNAATLQTDAGYGRQVVKADGDNWDSVIMNNFEEGVMNHIDGNFPDIYPFKVDYKKWNKWGSNTLAKPYTIADEIEQGVRLEHNEEVVKKDDRLWQCTQFTANEKDEVEISFKFTIQPGPKGAHRGKYLLRVQSYIRERDETFRYSLDWKKGDSNKTVYATGIGTDFISQAEFSKSDDWKDDFNVPIEVSIVAKFNKNNTKIDFNKLSFAVLPVMADSGKGWTLSPEYVRATIIGDIRVQVREKKKYDNTFIGTINRNYFRPADDIDIRFWTLPSKHDVWGAANYNFKNGLVDSEYNAIRNITCPSEGKYTSNLAERLLLDNFDQYYDSRDLLSGTVQAKEYLSPDHHFSIATREKKVFLLAGMEANLKEGLYDVELEEIKPHQITANIK